MTSELSTKDETESLSFLIGDDESIQVRSEACCYYFLKKRLQDEGVDVLTKKLKQIEKDARQKETLTDYFNRCSLFDFPETLVTAASEIGNHFNAVEEFFIGDFTNVGIKLVEDVDLFDKTYCPRVVDYLDIDGLDQALEKDIYPEIKKLKASLLKWIEFDLLDVQARMINKLAPEKSSSDSVIKGLAKAAWSVGSAYSLKSDTVKKYLEKLDDYISSIAELLKEKEIPRLVNAYQKAINDSIAASSEIHVDIDQFRAKSVKLIEDNLHTSDILKTMLCLLPFEPVVINQALQFFGDENGAISSVAERFGVDCNHEKLMIAKNAVARYPLEMEPTAFDSRYKYYALLRHLDISLDGDGFKKLTEKIEGIIQRHDTQTRTINKQKYPSRLEAILVRKDLAWMKETFGVNLNPALNAATRKTSLNQECLKDGGDVPFQSCLDQVVEAISAREAHSPFLEMVLRALLHYRDFSYYAGNTYYESAAQAKLDRPQKEERARLLFRKSSHVISNFALTDGGWFARQFSSRKNLENAMVARYFGDTPPTDLNTFYDLLKWQSGYDFFDKDPSYFAHISTDMLEPQYVSLVGLPQETTLDEVITDETSIDVLPIISYAPRGTKEVFEFAKEVAPAASLIENGTTGENFVEEPATIDDSPITRNVVPNDRLEEVRERPLICQTYSKAFTWSGRASRLEFWTFAIFYSVIMAVFALLIDNMTDETTKLYLAIPLLVFWLVSVFPLLGAFVRRLHDTNRSGWWYWIMLIPGLGAVILLVILMLPSVNDDNDYGLEPLH